jgi:hypothetical protein
MHGKLGRYQMRQILVKFTIWTPLLHHHPSLAGISCYRDYSINKHTCGPTRNHILIPDLSITLAQDLYAYSESSTCSRPNRTTVLLDTFLFICTWKEYIPVQLSHTCYRKVTNRAFWIVGIQTCGMDQTVENSYFYSHAYYIDSLQIDIWYKSSSRLPPVLTVV